MQNPFSKSFANHFLASYHKALFGVITNQLEHEHRQADGVEGLLHLLKVLY
jgi:hypothetical protein